MRPTLEAASLFIGTSSSFGVASIGLAASQPGSIDESTVLPLSLFLGGVALSAAFAWRVASARASITHKLDEMERRIQNLERQRHGSRRPGLETRVETAEEELDEMRRRNT